MNIYSSIFLEFAITVALLYLHWIWDDYRKLPLKEFGIERMQEILCFQNADYRELVWQRGWMTRKEWRRLLNKHIDDINAELKRRGLK